MDKLAKFNKERWEELAKANIEYSRPWLNLDKRKARELVDPLDLVTDFIGRRVLCLAAGGGQQSVAFALLGAEVTVLDLCETQLQRDRETARHYNVEVRAIHGDMRDLSCFDDNTFDIVWQAHSINFVPKPDIVFAGIARVLCLNGLYHLSFTNPFIHGTWEKQWNGEGYPIRTPYVDGEVRDDPYWDVDSGDGIPKRIMGPKEFRHTMSTLMNALIKENLVILNFSEDTGSNPKAEPGSWEHFKSFVAPWLSFWAAYRPYAFEGYRADT